MSTLANNNKPPKKKAKTIREQCGEDMALMKQKLTDRFSEKFDRFEQLLTALAKPASTQSGQQTSDSTANTSQDNGIPVPDDPDTQTSATQGVPCNQPVNFVQQQRIESNLCPMPAMNAPIPNGARRHVEVALGAPTFQVSGSSNQGDGLDLTPKQ